MELVVLAGGIGSRFGGLKQVEEIDEEGNFLLDYSIFDAIKMGVNKVVFVINQKNEKIFQSTIGKRLEGKIEVQYVFQNLDSIEGMINKREKPLGTAHALLCCKNYVKDEFIMINADDYYGKDAFKIAMKNIKKLNNSCLTVAFKLKNTLSENGSTKRGVIYKHKNTVIKINEKVISKQGKTIFSQNLDLKEKAKISPNSLVSMNFFYFTPQIFDILEEYYNEFLTTKNLLSDEFMLPELLNKAILENKIRLKVYKTNFMPLGLTYREDKVKVQKELQKLKNKGKYPKLLWQ